MEAYLNGKDKGIVTVTIDIDKDEFEKGKTAAFNKTRRFYNIPGFRKGKAPRKLIEDHYGKDIFNDDAVEEIINENIDTIYDDLDEEVISAPLITDIKENEDGSLEVTLAISVYPEPVLDNYKEYTIEAAKVPTDEDIDNELALEYQEYYNTEDEPVINDEFIQTISEFNTVDEYKDHLRDLLTDEYDYQNDLVFKDKLIEDLLKNSEATFSEYFVADKSRQLTDKNKQLLDLIEKYDIVSDDEAQGNAKYLKFFEKSLIISDFLDNENLRISPQDREQANISLITRGIFDLNDFKKYGQDNSNIILTYISDYIAARERLLQIAKEDLEVEDQVDA